MCVCVCVCDVCSTKEQLQLLEEEIHRKKAMLPDLEAKAVELESGLKGEWKCFLSYSVHPIDCVELVLNCMGCSCGMGTSLCVASYLDSISA